MTDSNNEVGKKASDKKTFPQTEMPRFSLKEVVTLAEGLRDNFAGSGASGIDLAKAVGRSPSSSGWRVLTGAAIAYGITDAGYNSSSISLTPLGKQIVMPTTEGEDAPAKMSAALRPAVLKNFYTKYDGARVPKDDIAKNVLQSMGVPQERAGEALQIALDNARYLGLLTTVGDGQFLQLRTAATSTPQKTSGIIPLPPTSPLFGGAIPTPSLDSSLLGGMAKYPIDGGKLVILMPSEFKDTLLDTDDSPELDQAWKATRAAMKELAKFVASPTHSAETIPTSEEADSEE